MSSRWQTSANSGDFGWSYPIPLPDPAAGRVKPELSLDYSSQAVDGRTSKENGQPSWAGEGWDVNAGFIERKFVSCTQAGHTNTDLCYQTPQLFLSFHGVSTEIIKDSTTGTYHLLDDPGWRLQLLTGASNGDNDGEYWLATLPDGVQYTFGAGVEPTSGRTTSSVANVTAYAANSSQPCWNSTLGYPSSYCTQAWRWSLDRVVDLHANTATYFYSKEINHYYQFKSAVTNYTAYDRAVNLASIDYGKIAGHENGSPNVRVSFVTATRCTAQPGACPAMTSANATAYPDVPVDQSCTASPCASSLGTPTFWGSKELTKISWAVLSSADVLVPVGAVDMSFTFPATGDGTSPALWLRDITRSGTATDTSAGNVPAISGATPAALGAVTFYGTSFANRVDTGASNPTMNKFRVTEIWDEQGGRTKISYGLPDPCTPTSVTAFRWPDGSGGTRGMDTNIADCFPQPYTDSSGASQKGWFAKYLTTSVSRTDGTGSGSPDVTTTYAYLDNGAWHWDNISGLPTNSQVWADWRGYGRAQEVTGAVSGSQTITQQWFYRGLDGDRDELAGTAKTASVSSPWGGSSTDVNQYAGRVREEATYTSTAANIELTRALHAFSFSAVTASGASGFPAHQSRMTRETQTDERVRLSDGTYSTTRAVKGYDTTTGQLTIDQDQGLTSTTSDDTCASYAYAVSTAAWITDRVKDQGNYIGNCSGQLSGELLTNYDLQGYGATPTKGDPTDVKNVLYSDASGVHWAWTSTRYDSQGRVVSTTDKNGQATSTTYTPSTGYAYQGIKVTDPLQHAATTIMDWRWAVPVTSTDANNQVTTQTYDALGRLSQVWMPAQQGGNYASYAFSYYPVRSTPPYQFSYQLAANSGNTYTVTGTWFDGLGHTRQVKHLSGPKVDGNGLQTSTGSTSVFVDTTYDDRGLLRQVADPQFDPLHGPTGAMASVGTPSSATVSRYDQLSRPIAVDHYAAGVRQYGATTSYNGRSSTMTPVVGGAVTTVTDASGRPSTVSRVLPTGTAVTSYGYNRVALVPGTTTPNRLLSTVTDAQGNVTSDYKDFLGRTVASSQPDSGLTQLALDGNGNTLDATDALNTTVHTDYDPLNRPVQTKTGTTVLRSWQYDGPTAGAAAPFIGRLYSASSFDPAGGALTGKQTMLGYDTAGRPTLQRYTVPAGSLSASTPEGLYDYAYTYDPMGRALTVQSPLGGQSGVTEETLTSRYINGYMSGLTGSNTYLRQSGYSDQGQLQERDFGLDAGAGATGSQLRRTFTYDTSSGRLTGILTTRTGPITGTVQNDNLGYDNAGDVTSRTDSLVGQRECFAYDSGLRVTAGWTLSSSGSCATATSNDGSGPSPYEQRWTYDSIDRITNRSDFTTPTSGTPVGTVTAFSYGASQPHAVTTLGGAQTYGYDPTGQMTTRAGSALAWSPLHQLASIGTSDTNVYGPDGSRLLHKTAAGTTLYLPGLQIRATPSGTLTWTRFYGNAAQRDNATGLTWLLADNQGSAQLAVPDGGSTSELHRYKPFGERRNTPQVATPKDFLGQPLDISGLIADGARFYDPAIGRFLNPDPLSASADPFSYALNNPVTFSDPSGLRARNTVGCPDGDCTVADQQHDAKIQADYNRAYGAQAADRDRFAGSLYRAQGSVGARYTFQGATSLELDMGLAPPHLSPIDLDLAARRHELAGQFYTDILSLARLYEKALGTGLTLELLLLPGIGEGALAGEAAAEGVDGLAPQLDKAFQFGGAGRSGAGVKNFVGPANSVVRGASPGRVFVTDNQGRVIFDITRGRVKPVVPGQGFVSGGGRKLIPTEEQLGWISALWGG